MKNQKRPNSLKKRAAAAALSLVMVFGMGAVLPESITQKGMATASAYNAKVGGHYFYYEIIGAGKVRINDVYLGDKVVNIPSKITVDGNEYTVTEIGDNFGDNCSIFAIDVPDTVVKIGDNFIKGTPVDALYLPDSLEYIGDNFCYNCPSLRQVTFTGTKLTHLGAAPFGGEETKINSYQVRYKTNSHVAACLGEWLIAYYGTESDVKVSELGGDTPIKYIADDAFNPMGALYYKPEQMKSVDLTGIKYIGSNAFKGCSNLDDITNGDALEYVGANALYYTKWFGNKKSEDKVIMGKELLWYRSADTVIDLTNTDFKEVAHVNKSALQGCSNAEGIRTRSTIDISDIELPKTIENGKYNEDLNALSELYVDGKEVDFNEKTPIDKDLCNYTKLLAGTQLEADLLRDKTKSVFSSLGIKYYGIGTFNADLSVEECYEVTRKIHDYISENYTFGCDARTLLEGYIGGKKMDSEKFASLYAYMLRCAGIETLIVKSEASLDKSLNKPVYDHSWVLLKLGDNWYHSDVCWDSASQGNCIKYFLLSDSAVKELVQHKNWSASNPLGLNVFDVSDVPECSVLHGDTNGDNVLSASDLEAYMGILKTKKIEATDLSDVDLDGDTDIDDMYRLNDILNSHPFTPTNQDAKPENEIMYKNAKLDEPLHYNVGEVKVIIASDNKIFNDEFLLSGYDGQFTLPEFNYKTSSYEVFEKWNVGAPGDEVQFTEPVVIISPVWVDNSSTDTSKKGDVNFDGTVDIVDAVTVISHINGTHVMSNKAMKAADLNVDTKIDIEDAVLLIGYVNGNNTL